MGAPASLVAQMVNNLPANVEGSGSILGLEKSPREKHGNPLQYSCLENLMYRSPWQVTVHWVTRFRHD